VSDRSFGDASPQELASRSENAPFLAPGKDLHFFTDDDEALAFAVDNSLSITVGIGENGIRARVAAALLEEPRYASLLRPLVAATASVDPTAAVGRLSQICEHSHVGPLARVGDGALINTAAVIEHEAEVGTGSHVAPGAVLLGAAAIGRQVFLGSGARVLPGVSVGDGAVLGAGAVATRALAGMTTYVGAPAKPSKSTKGQSVDA
jgi:sugar O-acyltransferase (sialic acid O-acetyltransferase NeuD family)